MCISSIFLQLAHTNTHVNHHYLANGRIGSSEAASIDDGSSDGKNDVVYIYPDVFPQERADEIKAAANLGLLDLGEIFSSWCNLFICALKSLCRYLLL